MKLLGRTVILTKLILTLFHEMETRATMGYSLIDGADIDEDAETDKVEMEARDAMGYSMVLGKTLSTKRRSRTSAAFEF
jgi:hypothetical protein